MGVDHGAAHREFAVRFDVGMERVGRDDRGGHEGGDAEGVMHRRGVGDRHRLRGAVAGDPRHLYEDSPAGKARAAEDMSASLERVRSRLANSIANIADVNANVRLLPPAQEANGAMGRRQGAAYLVDLGNIRARPRWTLPSVVHHELIPGHILQAPYERAAAAPEIQLRYASGYSEGWSTYAEQLADEAGAFTGAEKKGRKGKFELADQSTLFFDEVGDMPSEVQVKLLRVLQDGIFERVGSNSPRHSDFRLISATNRNFQEMITNGEFRLDLYYRISGVTIRMPSLRERPEDIPELIQSFLSAFAERHRTPIKGVQARVYSYLKELPWPGNVRQLLHEVEKAAIFCEGPEITLDNFRLLSQDIAFGAPPPAETAPKPVASGKIQDAIEEMEIAMIRNAMVTHKGNKKKVAEELGISRAYLYKKLSGEAPEPA